MSSVGEIVRQDMCVNVCMYVYWKPGAWNKRKYYLQIKPYILQIKIKKNFYSTMKLFKLKKS